MHVFRTMRYFPELARPLSKVKELQIANGRTWEISEKPPLKLKRKQVRKSTALLDDLCNSSSEDIIALKDFQRTLIQQRLSKKNQFSSTRETKLDPLKAANEKLTKISLKYDSRRVNNDLQGFVGAPMTIEEFDYQLKRGLNIWLPREELEALFESMDTDHNRAVDPVEFIKYFFKLSCNAREAVRLQMLTDLEHKQKLEQERISGEEERYFNFSVD